MEPIVWKSWGEKHVGNVRKINEDAYLDLPEQSLWVVADGMGGHSDGNIASTLIVENLKKYKKTKQLGINSKQILQILDTVNQTLINHAKEKFSQKNIVGSTVAILVANKSHNICLWAGDSRVYRYRNGILKQLTRDHTPASDMAEINRTTDKLSLDINSQAITRAIGAANVLFMDSQIQESRANDLYLLCSDGLNKELSDAEISNILFENETQYCANILLQTALKRGGRDNITVLIIQAPSRLDTL